MRLGKRERAKLRARLAEQEAIQRRAAAVAHVVGSYASSNRRLVQCMPVKGTRTWGYSEKTARRISRHVKLLGE